MYKENQVREMGKLLCLKMRDGSFPKEYLSNHGSNYTGGMEDLAEYRFKRYISSCAYYLHKKYQNERGVEYYG